MFALDFKCKNNLSSSENETNKNKKSNTFNENTVQLDYKKIPKKTFSDFSICYKLYFHLVNQAFISDKSEQF